jgi:YidC/Oxa1 family membrane protein insertase
MVDLFNSVMQPLEIVVAWIMVAWHSVLTAVGLPAASGFTWAFSIIGLVIVIRILLIPLFVKQIKASRGMQLIQPEVKKIQEKYKGKTDQASKQAMTQETMALYKDSGTNPFASCLPILLQSPIFFALFRVLNGIHAIAIGKQAGIGPLNRSLAEQADSATIFGAPLSSTFLHSSLLSTKILTVILIVLMSLSTFTTQRQLMMKNMPASALDNPFAQQQKILLYVLPLVFAVSGVNFPIGVLLYWLTTNVWSMGQQFYVIRRMPAPGSPAEKAMEERRKRRGGLAGGDVSLGSGGGGRSSRFGRGRSSSGASGSSSTGSAISGPGTGGAGSAGSGANSGSEPRPATQRQQPKRQPRSKRAPAQRPQSRPGQSRPGQASGGTRGSESEPDR